MPDKEFGIPLGAGESIINYRACSETSFFIIFMVGRNYFVSSVMKSMAEASWGICVSLSQGGGVRVARFWPKFGLKGSWLEFDLKILAILSAEFHHLC